MSTFEQGRQARRDNMPRDANPFPPGPMAILWDEGWVTSDIMLRALTPPEPTRRSCPTKISFGDEDAGPLFDMMTERFAAETGERKRVAASIIAHLFPWPYVVSYMGVNLSYTGDFGVRFDTSEPVAAYITVKHDGTTVRVWFDRAGNAYTR